MRLRAGDVVRCLTGGGGGYGDPAERDPASVHADILDGHVSASQAENLYRVTL
jgi:N-methylhydantoinase B